MSITRHQRRWLAAAGFSLALSLSGAPAHAQQSPLIPIVIGNTVGNMSANRDCVRAEPPPQAFKDEVTPLLDAALAAYVETSLRGDRRALRNLVRGPGSWQVMDGPRHHINTPLSLAGLAPAGVMPTLTKERLAFSNERVEMRGRWRIDLPESGDRPLYMHVDFVQGFWSGWKVRQVRVTDVDDVSMMPDVFCNTLRLPPL